LQEGTGANPIMARAEQSESPTPGRWEHFAHGADVGVRGIGPTVDAAFAQGALAMTAAIADPASVEAREAVPIECRSPDIDLLFYKWLNTLVFEMAVRKMLFGRFAVRIEGDRLTATAWGEAVDPPRHEPAVEVKGATLTQLSVRADEHGQWTAQCIVDV
jgi:tRNA nucleotidyltransferase (CCA-adding enzyme)